MSRKLFYLVGMMAVIGCASTPSRPEGSTAVRRGNVLSAEEMASAHADVNSIYDAIARLRPNWLAPRGTMSSGQSGSNYAQVFVDDQLVGDIGNLRNINAYQVGDVRYYDASQAGARFGLRAGTNGAIEVQMRLPGRQ
ncbi:MAG: hypothetical protein ACR2NS_05420 [Gemmatimonadaceae bacterium]